MLCLVPDFNASSIEVYGKCMENHTETQPLIKTCLDKMKEDSSENRLMTDFSKYEH